MPWKELKQIITGYQRADGPFALATLVKSAGSTYRHPGSRMLILPGTSFIGRLSAGCIEEEIANFAQAVILNGKPARCSFDLRARFACDGWIEVFIERLVKPNALINGLVRLLADRIPITVSTNYRLADPGAGTRIIDLPLADHAEEFVQEIEPPVRLIIFGDYFDAEAVAYLGRYLGWQVETVSDAGELPTGDLRTACVVMSHHFGRDVVALKQVLQGGYGYVGLLGPRQRKKLLIDRLINEGCLPRNVSALRSPAGLDIGSETAEEIAMAVIAEVQASLMGRNGRPLRDRIEPIHKAKVPICSDERR
ncbi:MAG: XdhC family protein [Verrucomicrobia bacterium]|nr:XdhC family protein [Verrucomicrobiota bacterium]MBV9642128.1 XdhC family protein [Verrucomicrobiota bacterium]